MASAAGETHVRQAFLQLEAEEMLDLYPRRGALVRPIGSCEDADVLEVRLLIEGHCAGRVAGMGGLLDDVLQSWLVEQEISLRRGGDGFVTADRAFHRAIVAANGNEILTRQYDGLRDRQQRITASAVARDPARIEHFIAEHRAIAEAIAASDQPRAVALTTDHLRGAHALARPPGN